jgi:putative ABC transport system substrate-binding protein
MKVISDQLSVDSQASGLRFVVRLCFALCALLLALCIPAEAQQPRVARIGYLSNGNPANESVRSEAIRLALRELGYTEGQNIAIEYRYAEGKRNRDLELAAELVRLKVDVIVVAGGASWVRAAKNATKTIPIVMVGSGDDPVEAGLVVSLARPGGNVTGITNLSPELAGKRLELLKESVAKFTRVALPYDPAISHSVVEVKEDLPVAARTLGLTVRGWEVGDAGGFERVFAVLNKERPDRLYVLQGPLMNANQMRIVAFASKSRLRRYMSGENLSMPADLCTTGPISRTATGASPITSIEFSRGRSPLISPSSSQQSLSS